MDATRTEDNRIVVIKRIKTRTQESKICQMLSTPERINDPHNHAVPLLDYFVDDANAEDAFIVMPLLRRFDDPEFTSVDEVIDFARQVFEVGLSHTLNRMFCLEIT